MSRFWSPIVHELTPYVPGEQPQIDGLVKLNTNENPYPPSPAALAAICEAADERLRLYPDPESTALRAKLAAMHGLDPAQVFVGNGSDEVLAFIFQALLRHERPLLYPDITYSFYPVYCALYGIAHETVPLDEALRIDVSAYEGVAAGGVILANPNAPTGIALRLDEIERLAAAHPDAPVVIDEAYVDFGAESAVALIGRHPNLLVTQTLSKSRSLAGLRLGLAFGQAPLIDALNRVKNSFNSYPIDRLAAAGALAALGDSAHFEATRAQIIAERDRLGAALAALGFEVLPSAANFVFARHPGHGGARLAAALREHAILVRHFRQNRIDQYLRITIGTPAQDERLLAALETILAAG